MNIKVISNIPGNVQVSGDYPLEPGTNIRMFLQTIGIRWNLDALVVVNSAIVEEDYELKDRDEVHLLIPILGG